MAHGMRERRRGGAAVVERGEQGRRAGPPRRARSWARLGAGAGACALAALTAGGFFLLGAGPGDGADGTRETATVLTVRVGAARQSPGHEVSRRYTGVVEARRRSEVGFELGGRVAEVRLDDGESVDAGAVVARLDTARLEARRAELVAARAEAAARAELAEATYARFLRSFERGGATEQEMDDAEQERDASRAALARVDRQIESLDVDIGKSTLVSPYDAVVARRLVDEGQVVDAGGAVLDLLERVAPEARIGLSSRAASSLSRGDSIEVRVGGRAYAARVVELLPVTARGTRTVEAVLRLDAELDGLRRGDLATIEIARRVEQPGFWLPIEALTESSRGLWACFVASATEGTAEENVGTHRLSRRRLEVLHTSGERVYVTGTLEEGELVVLEGLHRIVPGQRVRTTHEDGEPGGAGR